MQPYNLFAGLAHPYPLQLNHLLADKIPREVKPLCFLMGTLKIETLHKKSPIGFVTSL